MTDAKNHYYAIKTTSKQERAVADTIFRTVERKDVDIRVSSVIVPEELKGYVILESPEGRGRIQELLESIPSARALVPGETSLEDIQHYLEPKPVVSGIEEGTIVELIAGPFKGEKAVVKRIDLGKEEITVELYESIVPIPITVRGDHVRVIERKNEE